MAFKGAFREFDIASVFQFIQGHQHSGRLDLKSKGKSAYLLFSHGEIVLVHDSDQSIGRLVIQYLLAKGVVDDEAVRQLVDAERKDLVRLIRICIDNEWFDEGELNQVLQEGLMDLSCELFTWESGSYEFRPTDDEVPVAHPAMMLTPEYVTLEAMRRLDEWKELKQEITPSTLFKLNQSALGGKKIQVEGHSPLKHPAVHLLVLMQGEHTVSDLSKKSFLSPFRLYEVLDKLKGRGIIEKISYSEAHSEPKKEDQRERESGKKKKVSYSLLVLFGLFATAIALQIFLGGGIKSLDAGLFNDPLGDFYSQQKKAVAEIQYEAEVGAEPKSNSALTRDSKFLNSRDLP